MTTPQPDQGALPDAVIQVAAGLADTPAGQKLALTLTVLLGQDGARTLADGIRQVADQMSASGLVVAGPGVVPSGKAAGHG